MRVIQSRRNIQRVPNLTFGDNVRRLRNSRTPVITQEELARALELRRNAQISTYETSGILPEPETVRNVAAAFTKLLGREVHTSELLVGVVTEYDKLRGIEERDLAWQARGVEQSDEVNRHVDSADAQLRERHQRLLGTIRAVALQLIELYDTEYAQNPSLQATDRRTGTRDRRTDE